MSCNYGYLPSTPVQRVCIDNGNGIGVWDEGTITCEIVTCDPLQDPLNGQVTDCNDGSDVEDFQNYGNTCTTECNHGYTGTGSYSRTCLATGQWDGSPLQCEDITDPEVDCPFDKTYYTGEGMISMAVPFSDWEPVSATDAGTDFPATLWEYDYNFANGSKPSVFDEGTHNLKYRAVDTAGNIEECSFEVEIKVTRCRGFYAPQNGLVYLKRGQGSCQDSAVFGSECEIECEDGYSLSTGDLVVVRKCERIGVDGVWSGGLPQCLPKTCDVPMMNNGYVSGCSGNEVEYTTVCQFFCDNGFTTNTGQTYTERQCQADQSWSGEEFICDVQVTCPGFQPIVDGAIEPVECMLESPLPYGTECYLSCNSGYRQTGPYSKQCTADGDWSDSRDTTCKDVEAPRFDPLCPHYITQVSDRGTTTTQVVFDEPNATDNSGSASIVRQTGHKGPGEVFQSGTTTTIYTAQDSDGNFAQCSIFVTVEVYQCSTLQTPTSGQIQCDGHVVGNSCVFGCNDGYTLEGSETRTCEKDNDNIPYWDGVVAKCNIVTCPAVATPPNGVKSGCFNSPPDTENYGTLCTFYCLYGYEGQGDSGTQCQADGTWTTNNFNCVETICAALVPQTTVDITPTACTTDPSYGDICTYNCIQSGFVVTPIGSRQMTCLANGQWSSDTSNIQCQDVEAPSFTACPYDVIRYADRGMTSTAVEFEVMAEDNDGTTPTLSCNYYSGTVLTAGEHVVTCIANDQSGNENTCQFRVLVIVRRCSSVPVVAYGSSVGVCDDSYGNVCTVQCQDGYTLSGSNTFTCEYDDSANRMYWMTAEPPVCEVNTCNPVALTDPVQVYPVHCAGPSNPQRGTVCMLYCPYSFQLSGDASQISCQDSGDWDSDVWVDATCVDQQPPSVLSCPNTIFATLTNASGVEVTFTEPTADDNSGTILSVTKSPSDVTSPYVVTTTTNVEYSFCDESGNCAVCTFEIYVTDDVQPVVTYCPPDKTEQISGQSANISFGEPIFEEPTGDTLDITNNFDGASTTELALGVHTIIYQATNPENGNTVFCQFNIEVTGTSCEVLHLPENGGTACYEFGFSEACTMFCNENFNIPRTDNGKIPERFVCQSDGTWSPNDYVPDCSETRSSNRVYLSSDVQYYTNNCPTDEAISYISQTFIDLLMASPLQESACTLSDNCLVSDVVVTCGPVTARKKRSESRKLDEMNQKRLGLEKRSINKDVDKIAANSKHRNIRSDFEFLLTITFNQETNINHNPDQDDFSNVLDAEEKLLHILDAIQGEIDEGRFQIQPYQGFEYEVKHDSLNYDNFAELFCDAPYGTNNIDYVCVKCIKGTYYNNQTQECSLCPKGSYQDSTGQISCNSCPDGFTTSKEGSRSDLDCVEACIPGSYSETGAVTCSLCPIGNYQSDYAQTSCIQCPTGTTTNTIGSSSIEMCRAPCPAGAYSPDGFEPCSPCPRRYYQPNTGKHQCLICPRIDTTLGEGTISVDDCQDVNECLSNPCQNGATCNDNIDSYTCTCIKGYTDVNCQTNIDDCRSAPCFNGATCMDDVNAYICECTLGFVGADCSTDLNECSSSPCAHGGTCEDRVNEYICHCPSEYNGDNCQYETDFCQPNVCENSATCTSGTSGYQCACAVGYTGLNCETNIDDCKTQPCRHRGACTDGIGSYTCDCTMGYTGTNCEIDVDLCANTPCQNGGTCLDQGDVFTCKCVVGKFGTYCERNFDSSADESPCRNGGQFSVDGNEVHCSCAPGYVGRFCDVQIDDCSSSPCSNNGICIDGLASYECDCSPGFEGHDCEEDINECESNPCAGDSTCNDNQNGYTCHCPEGFQGQHCDQTISKCDEVTCANDGTCIPKGNGTFECECKPGYAGFDCAVDINECLSGPCEHGGTCNDIVNGFTCDCVEGFEGSTCETNIDECSEQPCSNKGTCQDGINDFTCLCTVDYTGNRCEIEVDHCIGSPCGSGTCFSVVGGGHTCSCPPGLTGSRCMTDIDDCASFPCINHLSCTDQLNDYICECKVGWTGTKCGRNIDECMSSPCHNGGQCDDKENGYICNCVDGFNGVNCEVDINECESNNCQNGATCIDGVNKYTCYCADGFIGKHCRIRVGNCHPNPCVNGGQCNPTIDSYTCTCLEGFTGDTCNIDIDDCVVNGCTNGATCIDQVNQYSCRCMPGFTGQFCNLEVDECASAPCQNGGVCIDGINGYNCNCLTGYTDIHCEGDIDDCVPNLCANGAECVDAVNSFECVCPGGYSGTLCGEDTNECLAVTCQNGGSCIDEHNGYTCACVQGFIGSLCDQVLPSDYDMRFTSDSSDNMEFDINRSTSISAFTVAFWTRVTSTSELFTLYVEYFNNGISIFSIDVTQSGIHVEINGDIVEITATVHDGKWHHVCVTWDSSSGGLQVYKDGKSEHSEDNFRLNDLLPEEGAIIMLLDSDGPMMTAEADVSGLDIWDEALDEDKVKEIANSCHSNIRGTLVPWSALLNGIQDNGIDIHVPSQCDDHDECSSTPCFNGGTCTDGLYTFDCQCPIEYTGLTCQSDVDFCDGNLCQNGATCDIKGTNYTCICKNGFTGYLCDVQIVDGQWSKYNLWSECTATCGGGTQYHTRTCDEPAPLNGGLDCYGVASETRSCNDKECPSCRELEAPENGDLDCNVDGNEIECNVSCIAGYAFGHAPRPVYLCGPSTSWVWNHERVYNPSARIPACTKKEIAPAIHAEVIVSIPNMPCTSDDKLKSLVDEIRNILEKYTTEELCSLSDACSIVDVKVISCDDDVDAKKKSFRMEDVDDIVHPSVSFSLEQQQQQQQQSGKPTSRKRKRSIHLLKRDIQTPFDNTFNDLQQNVNDLIELLERLTEEGHMTFDVDGVSVTLNMEAVNITGWDVCAPGAVEVENGYCVPCGIGTFFTWLAEWSDPRCYACLEGYYQDEQGQEQCKPCPDGMTSHGRGATSISDCVELPSTEAGTTIFVDGESGDSIALPLAITATIVSVVAVILLIVFIAKKVSSGKRYKQVTTMREDLKERPQSVLSTSAFGVDLPLDGKVQDERLIPTPSSPPPPYSETEA
ncbi:uncharacterized protein LOC144439473 [Glandiceps talaboti]